MRSGLEMMTVVEECEYVRTRRGVETTEELSPDRELDFSSPCVPYEASQLIAETKRVALELHLVDGCLKLTQWELGSDLRHVAGCG